MRRPKIKTALIGIFSLLALFFAAFVGATYDAITKVHGNTETVTEHALPGLSHANQIEIAFLNQRIAIGDHLLANTAAQLSAADDRVAATEKVVTQELAGYEPLISSDKEKALFAQIRTEIAVYDKIAATVIEMSRGKLSQQATTLMSSGLAPAEHQAMTSIHALSALNITDAQDAKTVSGLVYFGVRVVGAGLAGLVALVLAASIVFVIRSVANPIVGITRSMRTLAEGDTEANIPYASRSDEIGQMGTAVEIFRQAAIDNKRLEQEAEAARRRAEIDRITTQESAERDASERLQIATSGLAAGLRRLAAGDLDFQLDDAFAPDFEPLRHDFNQSVRQLGDALASIASGIAAIDSGTREISEGANDLSTRTEQQAASLEQTAAALDQITANVASSSQRTGEARAAATEANQSANRSAEVVGQAEHAMERIEQSSRQIASIISVIDEIAFQTNLLALNAGVEAARAGESGKGFAVVAQEVRELAQRSAKAAKEIKGLIQNASLEVQGGVKLVRDTGVALKTISDQITGINRHMNAIATSANEQSTGLAEVNTAVNSMDQTTQQNAAMVEQSNAASAALAMEAAKLRDLVLQFKLAGQAPVQAAALRQTARTMATPARHAQPLRQTVPQPRRVAAIGNAAVSNDSWEEF